MLTRKILTALTAGATMIGAAAMAADDSGSHTEIGALSCDVGDGTGYVFGSTRTLACTFNPVQEGAPDESYAGTINRYGLDIGKTRNGQMSWLVLAPTEEDIGEGALAGNYGGVSAEATIGVGAGANVMIGGSNQTIALQPVSVNAQSGLNFALGVAEINLEKVGG